MATEVVSAYTLLVGDADGPPVISVHTTADDAWRALDRAVRRRSGRGLRLPWRADAESAEQRANAWRAEDPACRYWNVTAHRLPIMVPEIARASEPTAR